MSRPTICQGRGWTDLVLASILVFAVCRFQMATAAEIPKDASKYYRITNGSVDSKTYNGYRRYHASCNHCHGSDGLGSTFGPALIEGLPEIAAFRDIVRNGKSNSDGSSVMRGFAKDPNIEPYIDDIYAYLQARADGVLGRGRPPRQQ
jgi:mono/diheme cytochrome c family protein